MRVISIILWFIASALIANVTRSGKVFVAMLLIGIALWFWSAADAAE